MLNKSEDVNEESISPVTALSNSKTDVTITANNSSHEVRCNKDEKSNLENKIANPVESHDRGNGDTAERPSSTLPYVMTFGINHLKEKLVFVSSVVCLIIVAYGMLFYQFIIPYFYVILAPLLIAYRLYYYWKLKWQLFLVDFCYFANAMTYIFVWAILIHDETFMVNFSLTNGPLVGAVIVYRNSLVFHDIDKITSVFIHLVPAFLTYCIRWYPETTDMFWYSAFSKMFPESSYFYLIAIPLCCFTCHTFFFFILIHVVLKPGEQYLNSYRYLTGKEGTVLYKLINLFNPRLHLTIYHVCNCLFCLVWLLISCFCYQYFFLHTIYLILASLVTIWNGASYYIDVFSKKGLSDPPS